MDIDILSDQLAQPFTIPETVQKAILEWAAKLPGCSMIGRFAFGFQDFGLGEYVRVMDLATGRKLEIVVPDDPEEPITVRD